MDEHIAANRELWDGWVDFHEKSEFYDLDSFRRGGVRLRDYELEEIGNVRGLSLLHLQCHFGIDSLSWSRLGARVTGVDFSARAIALARRLAAELGLEARFVEAEIYRLPEVLDEEFDLVYTSRGVLGWLPQVLLWAQVIARFVRPGGRFYITEIHPVANAFENEGVKPGELRLAYPYWEHSDEPLVFDITEGSYATATPGLPPRKEYGWDHSLGEIVSALINAGLRVDSLREYPFLDWKADFLVPEDGGRWVLPRDVKGRLPLMFSLLASKPA